MKKKAKQIVAIVLVVVFTLTLGITAFAHNWPSDLDDWDDDDWDAWEEAWEDYFEEEFEKEFRREIEREFRRDDDYRNSPGYKDTYYENNGIAGQGYYYNSNAPGNGNGYNYSYNYGSYNYYNGVMNIYDAGTEADAAVLAKIIGLYAHGVSSVTAQAAVGWTVMNSVDGSSGGVNIGVIAQNFSYNANQSTTDDFGRDLMPLARDIIFRWKAGRAGISSNGRVLPGDYCWVWSNGSTVYFRNTPNESGAVWNFSYQSPYGS